MLEILITIVIAVAAFFGFDVKEKVADTVTDKIQESVQSQEALDRGRELLQDIDVSGGVQQAQDLLDSISQ